MISQSTYRVLAICASQVIDAEVEQFVKPYVLVIHRPSGRGFYLDRQYRHIVDVKNCQEPEKSIEVARHHLCASSDLPGWVVGYDWGEFDSFWLY